MSSGPLGVVYADLQEALHSQKQRAIDAAQAAAERVLVELLPGHVLGNHVCVADLWEVMASVNGSRLGLGGVATGRCGCSRSAGPILTPCRVECWYYNQAVSITSHHLAGGADLADALEVMMHNLRANASRNQSSACCGSLTVYDMAVSPMTGLCVAVHNMDSTLEQMPELSNLWVNGQLYLLSGIIVRSNAHYTAYFNAASVSWLVKDGWYHYDGLRTTGRLLFLGQSLCIDKYHAHNIELLLFTCSV